MSGQAVNSDPSGRPAAGREPTEPAERAELPELIILTGMSGAGRSTAVKALEDQGWYVVDNLPAQLLLPLVDLVERTGRSARGVARLATVIDARSRGFFASLHESLAALRDRGWQPRVVFMDATEEALVRRFESVRRPHPLQGDGRLLDGIVRERALVGDLRSEADVIIDSSGLNVHQLAAKIAEIFTADFGPRLRIAVMSFGFKYGIPLDGDMVFDMRFLPNPFWIPELRPLTGRDRVVAEFVLSQPGAMDFVDKVVDLMAPVIEGYQREGRRYVTLSLGCTGGKHRSVAVAEHLASRLSSDEVGTILVHRDLGRE